MITINGAGASNAADQAALPSARPMVVVPTFIRVLQWVLAIGAAGYFVWLLIDESSDLDVRDFWYFEALLLLSAVLVAYRAFYDKSDRIAWAAMATGMLIWMLSDVLYTGWVVYQDPVPYPSISDWMYLALYPLAGICAIMLLIKRVGRPSINVWLDGLLVALGVAAFVWLAAPELYHPSGATGAQWFMSTATPLCDLLFVCLVVGILGVLGWRADPMWWLMLGGASLLWITNTAWLLNVATDNFTLGAILDVGWPIAFMLLAFAAWERPRRELTQGIGLRSSVIPVLVTASSFALLIYATQRHVSEVAVSFAACAILVGFGRLAQAFRSASVRAEMERQAYTDELTGLPNRRLMSTRLTTALEAHGSGDTPNWAFLLLDVNAFKEINDTLGHAAGDAVLQSVALRIRESVHSTATVARLGGDEFAILLGPGVDVDGAVAVADRIRAGFASAVLVDEIELFIDVSIGIATCPDHGDDRESLLRAADAAMYRAKRNGTGHAIYSANSDFNTKDYLLLAHELRAALLADRITCNYQPIIDVQSGRTVGLESLIRWVNPRLGRQTPAAILDVAERAGLMALLARTVLSQSICQAATWRKAGLPHRVSVNLSMTNLHDDTLPGAIAELLTEHDFPADCLVLEVTESVQMTDRQQVLAVLAQLGALGLAISVDDYGTGFSTLDHLSQLGASELKLDHSHVAGVATYEETRAIVAATILLAHGLGLRFVAEGVESGEDLHALQLLGADLAQGFHICPPQPAEQITRWLVVNEEAVLPLQRPFLSPADRLR